MKDTIPFINNFYKNHIKRVLDLTISVVAVIFLLPIFIVIGVLIKLDSRGPAIYKQLRVGKNTEEFNVYKFRTMVQNAEEIGPNKTSNHDSRITSIGKILRRYSLDELPQLFNVIKGDMSIVGYRPGLKEHYNEDEMKSELFNYRPGITGYAQINGRSTLTRKEKRCWEYKYCKDISLKTDVKIMILTIKKVLIKEGTN